MWQVTRIVEETQLDPTGKIIRGHRVYAETLAGTQFSVFVPDEALHPEYVRQILDEQARRIREIESLRGSELGV